VLVVAWVYGPVTCFGRRIWRGGANGTRRQCDEATTIYRSRDKRQVHSQQRVITARCYRLVEVARLEASRWRFPDWDA
jgi:hypothetical protein